MANRTFRLREAVVDDAPAIAAIYAPEVLHGTATFEIEAPDATEVARRIAEIQNLRLPFIVAAGPDGIAGYAYLAPFRSRKAFEGTVENSVYVCARAQRQGVGKALLAALIDAAQTNGKLHRVIAVIGDPETQSASISLHLSAGFTPAGRLSEAGYKFDRWLDVVLMELSV